MTVRTVHRARWFTGLHGGSCENERLEGAMMVVRGLTTYAMTQVDADIANSWH